MNTRSQNRVASLLVAFGFLALLVGLLATRLDPEWLIAGVLGGLAVALVLYDYRIGVVCLTLLLPWSGSALLPQTRGFNVINFLLLATLVALVLRRSFGVGAPAPLPRVVVWCYLLPIVVGVCLAWPHLPEGAANFPERIEPHIIQAFTPESFLKGRFVKPLFFVLYAFLTAHAVRDSKKPELYLIALGLSALVPSFAIIGEVINGGDVMDRDAFLRGVGMQVNEYGMLLSLAAGPLLFLCVGSGPRHARLASGVAFSIVTIAIFLTASRGAATAYMVIVGVWLLRRRKFTDVLLIVAVAAFAVVVMPDRILERLTLGFQDVGQTDHGSGNDALTQGRGFIWSRLAPEFWVSPIWGRGLGSTAWNSAVTAGQVWILHPHNLYLAVLLDLGILGFAAIMYLYFRYGRTFRALSRESTLSPVLRDYFSGAFASFLGMLAFAVTNGHYVPHPEQTFLWLALGFAFAYWPLGQTSLKSVQGPPLDLLARSNLKPATRVSGRR